MGPSNFETLQIPHWGIGVYDWANHIIITAQKVPIPSPDSIRNDFGQNEASWETDLDLILNIKDILIFASKISKLFLKLDKSAKSVLCM